MASQSKIAKHYSWTIKLVNEHKAAIKRELDETSSNSEDASARLTHILQRIVDHEALHDDESRLKTLILGMSALIHHEKRGGLTERQVEDICDLIAAILKVQNLDRDRSVLSGLYNEFHLVLGQLQRKAGDHWAAAWEQFMGNRFAIHHDDNAEIYQVLATGNRLLRLGYRDRAEKLFTEIDGRGDGNTRFRSRMGLIICRRLMGDFEQARKLIDDGLKSLSDLTPAWRRDMAWEGIICQATEEKDTTPMILATQRGGSHFGATYIVEAAVLTMAQKKKSMLERIRPIHAIRRDKSLRPRERWPLMTIAESIQKAYDTTIPIDIRVQDLGKVLLLAKRVPSVDGEMAVWVAAARWFFRMHIEEPLLICLGSYENLSMMVSGYTNKDAMGLVDDMGS